MRVTFFILTLASCLFIAAPRAVQASDPSADVQAGNAIVQRALTAAQSGDFRTAQQEYSNFKNQWTGVEDGVRGASRDDYRAIEARMRDVDAALVGNPPNQPQLISALGGLDQAQKQFVASQGPSQPVLASPQPSAASAPAPTASSSVSQPTTVTGLLQQLSQARTSAEHGDYSTAATQLQTFENTWPDVEGQVKTRSVTAYNQTENDMGLAMGLLNQQSPEAKGVLDRMYSRLAPYTTQTQYGVFDAAVILLREGLEALLVLVALLAVLTRSGASAQRGWVWSGAAVGLGLSIALGVGLHLILSGLMNPGNRELIEGVTGLVAAAMLLYVSYWLHSNTSISGWQRQIHRRTNQALTTGSLMGLAFLAFLAIFREGAETVLFFLGMAAAITTRDLLLGLGIGAVALAVLGTLIMVVGIRIPMRPFFAVAGLLVFYLCFKFLGTGIHALQVAGVLPMTSSAHLPTLDFFGLSPTWQTTIPQLLLLMLAASILLQDWLRGHQPVRRRSAAPAGGDD
jgi:high-affinity iron transporter